jgi:hypothetical protein
MWGYFKDVLDGGILAQIYLLKFNLLTSLLIDQNSNMNLEFSRLWFRASSFIKLNKNQLDAPLF